MDKNSDLIINKLIKKLNLNTRLEKKIAILIYRELSKGTPVSLQNISKSTCTDIVDIQKIVQNWEGVYFDDENNIIEFWGLTITRDTIHKILVDDKKLNTWCFFDALFIPEILQKPVTIESQCPISDDTIKLEVSSGKIVSTNYPNGLISFVNADERSIDVISSFCCYISFFPDEKTFDKWKVNSDKEGIISLKVDEAFKIGEEFNNAVFGDLISSI